MSMNILMSKLWKCLFPVPLVIIPSLGSSECTAEVASGFVLSIVSVIELGGEGRNFLQLVLKQFCLISFEVFFIMVMKVPIVLTKELRLSS